MAIAEQLVLPGLIVAIIFLTYIAMRGDARQRRKMAEAANAKPSERQDHDVGPPEGRRSDRR
jgi:hypothetical protein